MSSPGNKVLSLLTLAARLILATVFIWAAIGKIQAPQELARIITGYQIAPAWLIGPAAIYLPWLELWGGIFVLIGPQTIRRSGAMILAGLLLIFMAAIGFNLARGLDFDCGCFGPSTNRQTGPLLLVQDGLLFLASLLVIGVKNTKNYQHR